MMKYFYSISTLLATMLCFSVGAQTINIGTGTSNSDNSPIQRAMNYSASELLFLSSEINTSGMLTDFGFYKASGSTSTTIDSVYIYVKTTSATVLTGTSSTIGYTLAYQGPFPNNVSSGWVTVTFNMISGFNYSTSAGNLSVLLVRPYQASTTSRPYYRYTTITGSAYNAWYKNDTAAWSGSLPSISPWRPNTRLVFTAAPVCAAPTAPVANNITTTSAQLDWAQTGSPINYQIKYGAAGFNVATGGTSVFTAAKPYTLNPPLTANTSYDYYVRAICSAGDTSAWSPVKNFTTLNNVCPTPTALSASSITTASAQLDWTQTGSPINYQIKYGAPGFNVTTGGTSVFTATKPYTLNPPLSSSTSYDCYVRAICSAGDTSAWSTVKNFTTLCSPPSIVSTKDSFNCGTGNVILEATTSGNAGIKWYNAATGGVALGNGNLFTTPVLSATTNFYAEAVSYYSIGQMGRNDYTGIAQATPNSTGTGQGIRFNALADINLDSVAVWVVSDTGRIIVQLQDAANAVMKTDTFMFSGSGATSTSRVKIYLPVNYSISTGNNYKILALYGTTASLSREQSVNPPFANYKIDNVIAQVSSWVNGASNTANYYYFYNFYVSTGCASPRQAVTATIKPLPIVNLGNDTTICPGVSYNLNAGNAGATYLWSPGGQTSQSVNVNAVGQYAVTVTLNGCVNQDTILITPGVTPVNIMTDTVNICNGDVAVLNAGNAGSTYLWSPGGATTQTINVNTEGNYSVDIRSVDGCVINSHSYAKIRPLPVNNLGADTAICESAAIVLDAGNPGSAYNWSTGANTQAITVSDSGTYSVVVTTPYNCTNSEDIHVAFMASPDVEGFNFVPKFFEQIGRIDFSPLNPTNVDTYVWDFGDGTPMVTQMNPVHVYTASGSFVVTLKVGNDCTDYSVSQSINVGLPPTGVNNINKGRLSLDIYPNPANDVLYIEKVKSDCVLQDVWVYNTVGAVVFHSKADSASHAQVPVKQFANGIYVLKVLTDKGYMNSQFQVIK